MESHDNLQGKSDNTTNHFDSQSNHLPANPLENQTAYKLKMQQGETGSPFEQQRDELTIYAGMTIAELRQQLQSLPDESKIEDVTAPPGSFIPVNIPPAPLSRWLLIIPFIILGLASISTAYQFSRYKVISTRYMEAANKIIEQRNEVITEQARIIDIWTRYGNYMSSAYVTLKQRCK